MIQSGRSFFCNNVAGMSAYAGIRFDYPTAAMIAKPAMATRVDTDSAEDT